MEIQSMFKTGLNNRLINFGVIFIVIYFRDVLQHVNITNFSSSWNDGMAFACTHPQLLPQNPLITPNWIPNADEPILR